MEYSSVPSLHLPLHAKALTLAYRVSYIARMPLRGLTALVTTLSVALRVASQNSNITCGAQYVWVRLFQTIIDYEVTLKLCADDELTCAESMRRQRVPRIGLHIKPPAGLCLSAQPRLLVQGTFPGERDDMHVQHSILCYTHGMHGVPGLGRERRVFDAVVDMDNELQRGSARAVRLVSFSL